MKVEELACFIYGTIKLSEKIYMEVDNRNREYLIFLSDTKNEYPILLYRGSFDDTLDEINGDLEAARETIVALGAFTRFLKAPCYVR